MKGTIHRCLEEMIKHHFNDKVWEDTLVASNFPISYNFTLSEDVDEEKSLNLVLNSAKVAQVSVEEIFDLFGEYWVCTYAPKVYSFWYIGIKNAKDFILKLDGIHGIVGKHFNQAAPPRFLYEEESPTTLLITYQSNRSLIDLFISLVKGVGIYFKETIQTEKLSDVQLRITFAE
ncbi:MAG: hypothetical protein EAZ55_01060 [Cytophagales bacterium]|nr:MAG: hypothetical protein EAZ55_01060 [Cytophagales bacterium]